MGVVGGGDRDHPANAEELGIEDSETVLVKSCGVVFMHFYIQDVLTNHLTAATLGEDAEVEGPPHADIEDTFMKERSDRSSDPLSSSCPKSGRSRAHRAPPPISEKRGHLPRSLSTVG